MKELVSVSVARDSRGPLQFTFTPEFTVIMPGGHVVRAVQMERVYYWLQGKRSSPLTISDVTGDPLTFTCDDGDKWFTVTMPDSSKVRADRLERALGILLDV